MSLSRKITMVFLLLMAISLATGLLVITRSQLRHELLPAAKSYFPWFVWVNAGANSGAPASIDLRESTYNLNFDFRLPAQSNFPFAILGVTLDEKKSPTKLMDWSPYSSIIFRIKCRPANVLTFVLYSHEASITDVADLTSYRPVESLVSCSEEWQDVRLELDKLNTPVWWLEHRKIDIANHRYALDKVRGFSIINSYHSPKDLVSNVSVEAISLEGRNNDWFYLAIMLGSGAWAVFGFWAITLIVRARPLASIPLAINYEPLEMDSKQSRDKAALIHYISQEYMNPELGLEGIAMALGINRTKINQILREETGLTLSSYLNKLRLTEAARLLTEKQLGVAEAAYAVGYGSVSYFNRVFRNEYGCAPTAYKPAIHKSTKPKNCS